MLMIGHKPDGCHTEQHDIFFSIAEDFLGTENDARAFKPTSPKIHIDAYREVTNVDGYIVSLSPKEAQILNRKKLFFINLGGYKSGVFNEFHYPMLVVADTLGEAIKTAKESAFCIHHPGTSSSNRPHVDDEYGVDVDDSYNVQDILPAHLKAKYKIVVSDFIFTDVQPDVVSNGYQKYEKLKK